MHRLANPALLLAVGFCYAGFPPRLDGETLDAAAAIQSVMVYPDRARVTRSAQVRVPAGEHVIRFGGLPAALHDSTVQAGATADREITLLGTDVRRRFTAETVDETLRGLQGRLQRVQDRMTDLETRITDNNKQLEFLNRLQDAIGGGEEDARVSITEIRDLYAFHDESLRSLSESSLRLRREIRDLKPEKERLESEIARLRSGRDREDKEVLVAVRSAEAATAEFEISYNVPNASWSPLYDARVNTSSGDVELTYYGVVRQNTGEDWNDVRLALSTARPSAGAVMPELPPWWIQILEPRPMSSTAPAAQVDELRRGRQAGEADSIATLQEFSGTYAAPVGAKVETADLRSSGVTTVFESPLPATIPADNESHRVALTQTAFEGEVEAVATPKLSLEAFLRAKVKNTSSAPLLAGPVNLFRDGDFVGTGALDLTAPDEEFDFYLGVDDGIRIERKLVTNREERTGLIRRRNGLTRKYETEIKNLRRKKIPLVVYDQLPVSQSGDVQVGGVKIDPRPEERNEDTGELTWNLELGPGEKTTLSLEFTVEWPEDKQVIGL